MGVTWWYCISIGWYWLVLGDTGSKQGGTGCQCDMLSENIWFTWSKPSYYSIFGKEKSVDGVEKKSIEKEMQKTKKVSRCWWVGGGGTPNRTSGQTSRPPPVTSHSPNKF